MKDKAFNVIAFLLLIVYSLMSIFQFVAIINLLYRFTTYETNRGFFGIYQ